MFEKKNTLNGNNSKIDLIRKKIGETEFAIAIETTKHKITNKREKLTQNQ